MDSSGNNRYELLFMDDESSSQAPVDIAALKNQPKTTEAIGKKKPQVNKKLGVNAEKENKSAALNKNESTKKISGDTSNAHTNKTRNGPVSDSHVRRFNGGATSDGNRGVDYRPGNNEIQEQRPNRRNFREENVKGSENNDQQRAPRQLREREYRGPPRNRNGEGGIRIGKREFDRQSGSDKTGVKSIDKRDGAGAHNWGSVKQEINDINKPSNDTEAGLTDKEESANDQSTEQIAVPEEDEAKELTLDEWKAMREVRNKPQYNLRKAGEGEDTTQWKKMVALNKKKDGDSGDELEYDPSMYPQRVGRLQRIVDIQFNFNDGRRGGGSGGRGRGRGGFRPGGDRSRFEGGRESNHGGASVGDRANYEGNREGGRGGGPGDAAYANVGRPRNYGDRQRGGQNALKVDDERQFPTLS